MLAKLLKSPLLQILVLIFLAVTLRLYKIDAALADWHSWRQSDTASVTREFIKHNYSIFEPHYQDLSNIPSGLNNLEGWRMVEFPIINFINAKIISSYNLDLVVFSRLSSIFFSIISLVSLYFIVLTLSKDKLVSFASGLAFAVMPYSVFYSRVILPEPAMIAMQLLSIWLFIVYLDKKNVYLKYGSLALSITTFALALLIKPTAIFMAPVFIVLSFYSYGLKAFMKPELYLFLISLAPVYLWRQYILDFPSGIPASDWLYNGNGIRLKPAWWRWLFADRLGKLILGYWGTILVVLGLIGQKSKRLSRFDLATLTMAAGCLAYLIVFATGNVQHDYYQALLIPTLAILVGRGATWLLKTDLSINKYLAIPGLIVIVGLSLFLSWYEVRGFFNVNNPAIVAAGQAVDQTTPAEALIIAPYGGDTAFLFQTNRTGWPIGYDIEHKIELGATHYVSTTYDDEARALEQKYVTLTKNDQFILIDLTKSNSEL